MPADAPTPTIWARLLNAPASAGPADRHHGRLLRVICLVTGGLDLIAGIQTRLFVPSGQVISTPLLLGTIGALIAFALNGRGARPAALGVLIVSQLLVPAVITLGVGDRSDIAVLTLGVWTAPAIIIGSAFLSHRSILGVGATAAVILVATLALLHGFGAVTTFEAAIFVATVTSLAAVAARHRDQLDAIHQAELRSRNEELQHLRDSLEERVRERTAALLGAEKMAAIGRLTAGIAHELSSPLAAVLASVEDLKELVTEYDRSIDDASVEPGDHRAIAREMTEALAIASRASERSVTFVRSVKAQTRVSAPGEIEEFDVAALVRDCAHLLGHAARAASCTLVVRAEGELRTTGLPGRLGQAVTNLLQNAIDATGERGGGEIVAAVTRDVEAVVIRVDDHGGGIADDVLPRIFEPLFTTKPYGRGTGLGLAVVKEAVEGDLAGRIYVKTASGVGTTFVIELPATGGRNQHAA